MLNIDLIFNTEPKPIQSVRAANIGGYIRMYQPRENLDWKQFIRLAAGQQLPADWQIITGPVKVNAEFMFAPLKSFPKRTHNSIIVGNRIYKPVKPDLCDNLMKGLIDALTGLIWRDDAQICEVHSFKYYAIAPSIRLSIAELDEMTVVDNPMEPDLFQFQ